MFCPKCGKVLDNNATFCPYCGTVLGGNAPQSTPNQYTPNQYTPNQYPSTQYPPNQYTPNQSPSAQYPPNQYTSNQYTPTAGPTYTPSGNPGTPNVTPKPPRAKLSTLSKILIGAGAVAAVAAVVIGLVVSGVFSGDKGKLERAVAKSRSAYTSAAKSAGLPDLKELLESKKYSQSGEIALEDIDLGWYTSFIRYDVSALEGLGIRFSANYDLSGEKMSASVTPFYGSADLATAELVMDGSRVYVNSPELLGNTYYGLDTMTLGKDLQNLDVDDDVAGDLSFNLFQLARDVQEITQMDEESKKALEDAGKTLYKAIEVDKTGADTIRVNSGSVKCTAYTVVIPEDAMRDYLKEAKSIISDSVDYKKALTELFSSIHPSDEMMDAIKDMLSDLNTKQAVKNMFSELEDQVKTLGDVELQVYVSDGYVMAVTFSGRILQWGEKTKIKMELYLGGGANYVDDLSLVVNIDDYADTKIELTSHGDHSAKNGAFKDETVLEVTQYDYTNEISSEISYAYKSNQNFSWRIDLDGARIDMEGQLITGKDSMELHLDELEVRDGEQSYTLRVDYSIGAYQSIPSVNSPVMISTLNEDKVRDILDDIRDNAEDWAYDLMDEIPELGFLFYP